MKLLILICGEGLWHTSRCLAFSKEFLAARHMVYFGAYGYSKELVEKTGYVARRNLSQKLKKIIP
jgi:UDP:flavonoid glycosyltransferase YjiC (YdhE family)